MNITKKLMSIIKVFFDDRQRNFYFILSLPLVAILFTHPFLKYHYDMFHHLIMIDTLYYATETPTGRELWHFLWAKIFYFLSIPNNDVFFRAKIIHVTQTYIAFFSIFFFSKVMIRNIFKEIDITILNYLSLWSVLIWFTIYATFTMYYQQVWNLWYSVNYQITLPLFWYITALTMVIFLEKISVNKKVFFIIQIILISRFIIQVHSMEFLYYLMYLSIFGIIYIDKVYSLFKKYFYILIPSIFSLIYFIKKYQPEKSKILNYLDVDKFSLLYQDIMTQGQLLVDNGFNRAEASINELMLLILYIGILFTILIIIQKKFSSKALSSNFRAYFFLIITSMFALIPLYDFSAGLFAIITRMNVVNRLYYSSSMYIILPIFLFFIFSLKKNNNISIFKINLSFILILSSIWLYSKHYSSKHTYYKNIVSIQNSFFKNRIGFNLSSQQIELIGKQLDSYEKKYQSIKEIYYYARPDIAFVIKYIYRKNVLWRDYRANLDHINYYRRAIIYDSHPEYKHTVRMKNRKKYDLVLFKIPSGFPKYHPYK